jgi:hypothetical protein
MADDTTTDAPADTSADAAAAKVTVADPASGARSPCVTPNGQPHGVSKAAPVASRSAIRASGTP